MIALINIHNINNIANILTKYCYYEDNELLIVNTEYNETTSILLEDTVYTIISKEKVKLMRTHKKPLSAYNFELARNKEIIKLMNKCKLAFVGASINRSQKELIDNIIIPTYVVK